VVKVRGNAGERRSWAPKKCQLAFLGPTQAKFQGERKGERSSWTPNNGGQRSPALHNRWHGPWETLVERVPRTLITAITCSAVPMLPMPSLWLVQTDSQRSRHVMDSNARVTTRSGLTLVRRPGAVACCCCWQLLLHQHACGLRRA